MVNQSLNDPVFIVASIRNFLIGSAAEAEIGALFYNCQDSTILLLMLDKLEYQHLPPPVHCDNSKAVAIANDKVKEQYSHAIEKNFFGSPIRTAPLHWQQTDTYCMGRG
jgi:hypothetical protein